MKTQWIHEIEFDMHVGLHECRKMDGVASPTFNIVVFDAGVDPHENKPFVTLEGLTQQQIDRLASLIAAKE